MPDDPKTVTLGNGLLTLTAQVWGNVQWQYQIVLHAVSMKPVLGGSGQGVNVVLDYQYFDLSPDPRVNETHARDNAEKHLALLVAQITAPSAAEREALEAGADYLDAGHRKQYAKVLREIAARGRGE